jgi:arylsulfatase A
VPTTDAPSTAAPQLYNLDQDPSEKYDLASKRGDLVGELRTLADDHAKTVVTVKNQIATRPPAKAPQP